MQLAGHSDSSNRCECSNSLTALTYRAVKTVRIPVLTCNVKLNAPQVETKREKISKINSTNLSNKTISCR